MQLRVFRLKTHATGEENSIIKKRNTKQNSKDQNTNDQNETATFSGVGDFLFWISNLFRISILVLNFGFAAQPRAVTIREKIISPRPAREELADSWHNAVTR
jgi:hypothetical protein